MTTQNTQPQPAGPSSGAPAINNTPVVNTPKIPGNPVPSRTNLLPEMTDVSRQARDISVGQGRFKQAGDK